MELKEIFSKNLIKFRKAKGLSQRDLAKITGLTQRIINYYENNPPSIPINRINVIIKALNIKISDLFEDENLKSEYEDLDIRWIKKIQDLKKLSEEDRKEINKHINYLLNKSKQKQLQEVNK